MQQNRAYEREASEPYFTTEELLPKKVSDEIIILCKQQPKLEFLLDEKILPTDKIHPLQGFIAGFVDIEVEEEAKSDLDLLGSLIAKNAGVCRHRMQIFLLLARFLKCPACAVTNGNHAFIELPHLTPGTKQLTYSRLDLGGGLIYTDKHSAFTLSTVSNSIGLAKGMSVDDTYNVVTFDEIKKTITFSYDEKKDQPSGTPFDEKAWASTIATWWRMPVADAAGTSQNRTKFGSDDFAFLHDNNIYGQERGDLSHLALLLAKLQQKGVGARILVDSSSYRVTLEVVRTNPATTKLEWIDINKLFPLFLLAKAKPSDEEKVREEKEETKEIKKAKIHVGEEEKTIYDDYFNFTTVASLEQLLEQKEQKVSSQLILLSGAQSALDVNREMALSLRGKQTPYLYINSAIELRDFYSLIKIANDGSAASTMGEGYLAKFLQWERGGVIVINWDNFNTVEKTFINLSYVVRCPSLLAKKFPLIQPLK